MILQMLDESAPFHKDFLGLILSCRGRVRNPPPRILQRVNVDEERWDGTERWDGVRLDIWVFG